MSKLQPREILLLKILGAIIVGGGFVMFILLPKFDEKNALIKEIETANKTLATLNVELTTLKEKDKNLNGDGEATDFYVVEPYAGEFFPSVNQDDILMMLERFMPVEAYLNDAFFLGDVAFEEQTSEIALNKGYDIKKLQDPNYNNAIHNIVHLEFVGNYSVVEDFIKNIKNYQYPIYINGLRVETFDPANPTPVIDLNSEDPYNEVFIEYVDNGFRYRTANEDFVKGTLTLDFFELPVLTVYDDTNVSEQLFASSNVEPNANPFMPFQGFFTPTVIEKEVVEETPSIFDEPRDPYIYKNLYNFENPYFFFVGQPVKEVSGTTTVAKNASKGKGSLGLEYNFAKSFNENRAFAVAEGENIAITESTDGLTMDIYSESTVPHTFGLVLRDKNGVETDVPVVAGFTETGWQEYSVELPKNITFPCIIQRFYVSDNNEKSATSNNIYIDNVRTVHLNDEEE